MKRIAIVLGACLMSALSINAQEVGFHVGARFSLGTTNLDITNSSSEVGKLSFDVGVASQYVFHPNFVVGADFLIGAASSNNSGYETGSDIFGNAVQYDYEERYRLAFAEAPITVMPRLRIKDDFYLKGIAGVAPSFFVGGVTTRTYDNSNYNDDHGYTDKSIQTIESFTLNGVFGGGIDVVHADGRTLFLEARYYNGFDSIGLLNGNSASLNRFKMSIGYTF